jgi:oleandomycin transport system ATP-binding protein
VLAVTPQDPGRVPQVEAILAARHQLSVSPATDPGTVIVQIPASALVPALVRDLDEAGVVIEELALRKASLEEVFLALTGEPAEAVEDTDPAEAIEATEPAERVGEPERIIQ